MLEIGKHALQIAGDTVSATVSGVTTIALPTAFGGERARYVALTWDAPATSMEVQPVPNSGAAFVAGPMLQYTKHPYILNVAGMSHLKIDNDGAASLLRVTPLENH